MVADREADISVDFKHVRLHNIHSMYVIKVCYRDAFNYLKVNLLPYSVYLFIQKWNTRQHK